MLTAWEYHRQIFIVVAPTDDVHHGLRLVLTLGQRLVEPAEQLLVAILRTAADEQGRTGIILDERYALIVVEADDGREVVAQSLPRFLQWQHTTRASLEMRMIGG